jgi:hypothetical protein
VKAMAAWSLVFCWVGSVTPAWAEATLASSKKLRAELAEAQAAHERNDFEGCAARYQALYEATKAPDLLFNMATCKYDGGNDAEAAAALRRVLELGEAVPQPVREKARYLLDAIEQAAQPPAVAPATPLTAEPSKVAVAPVLAQPPMDAGTPSYLSAYLLGGATLLGLGVSTGFGVAALNNWHAAQRACPEAARCPDDRGHELSARARRQGNVATAGFALSAAAGVGTALLFWLGSKAPDPAGIALHVDGSSVSLGLAGTL